MPALTDRLRARLARAVGANIRERQVFSGVLDRHAHVSAQLAKGNQSPPRLIPKREPHARKALDERKAAGTAELRVVAQHRWQSIVRNATAQMMHVVNADIGGEPTHDKGQIVVRAAMQRDNRTDPTTGGK